MFKNNTVLIIIMSVVMMLIVGGASTMTISTSKEKDKIEEEKRELNIQVLNLLDEKEKLEEKLDSKKKETKKSKKDSKKSKKEIDKMEDEIEQLESDLVAKKERESKKKSKNSKKNYEGKDEKVKNKGTTVADKEDSGDDKEVGSEGSGNNKTMTMNTSYYGMNCEGCSGTTASGETLSNGQTHKDGYRIVAADTSVLPMNTKIKVTNPDGDSYHAIVLDRGGAIKGQRLDVLTTSESKASVLGRHETEVEVLN